MKNELNKKEYKIKTYQILKLSKFYDRVIKDKENGKTNNSK